MLTVNKILNQIHEWGEPEQSPMTRIGLTRIGIIACGIVESTVSVAATVCYVKLVGDKIKCVSADIFYHLCYCFGRSPLNRICIASPSLSRELWLLTKRITGMISTLLLGVFSPEVNFRIHCSLGLITNNLAIRKEKVLKNKLETEAKAAKIAEARAARLVQLQQQKEADKQAEEQRQHIDGFLAERLLSI